MKKIISIIAVLLIVAVFASGCGSDKGTTANNQRPNETVVSEIPTVEPKPTDVVDDPTGQPTTNLTSQITSADLEPYFGEGDAAIFAIAQNNVAPADGDVPHMDVYLMVFYRDGTIWSQSFRYSEPEESLRDNLTQSILKFRADEAIASKSGYGGEYQIVNGEIVFTIGDRSIYAGDVLTYRLDNLGNLQNPRGAVWQYVGYINLVGQQGDLSTKITFSDNLVLEGE